MKPRITFAAAAMLAACAAPPGERLPRTGQEISVCGQLFDIGTPVVLWYDPGGYDAYRADHRFTKPKDGEDELKIRFGARTAAPEIEARVAERGWTLEDLQEVVDLFVIHYDVCGTSRFCFRVLEARGLSVHFMLDADGTIYQTLDLKERAWHASQANSRGVGIEIAHIGAYPAPGHPVMKPWYPSDEAGPYIHFPARIGDPAQRTPDFVGRPARAELVDGVINGKRYWQYDFTEEQYRALARLTAGLHRVLPKIALEVPRDEEGAVLPRALSEDEFAEYSGLLGHWHVTTRKQDPGPAFDWERVLGEARELVE